MSGKQRCSSFSNLSLLLLLLIPLSCISQKRFNQNKSSSHYEDLSIYRPIFTLVEDTLLTSTPANPVIAPPPVLNVNQKVDLVLDSIDLYNVTLRFIDGYTIQVYSGQNREDAMNAKKKLSTDLPNYLSNLQYTQPKFRLTIGKYYNKLEAQKDLLVLRKFFANSILIPERIPIR
ncbi:MAG: SPOR domain-containing protein [Flammeovirgaceae bacterium]|nr:SPOR domain-containing protein [Flammeovirgaceae bacterium]